MNPIPTREPINIVLVDDSMVVRAGLRVVLEGPDIHVVGDAGTAAEGLRLVERLRPRVLILDLRLPDQSGFDACRAALALMPELRVLILTSSEEEDMVNKAIHAGAHGYLLKEIDGDRLVRAILDVADGKSVLDPQIAAHVLELMRAKPAPDPLGGLAPQEFRVVQLVAEGLTNKEIAERLKLAEKTVKNYLSNAFDKLGITRRIQAAGLFAQRK